MQKTTSTKQKIRVIIFATLLISIISLSGFAVYAMQSVSIPLEIKEPLEIIDYPTSLSLYAGETTNFEFTVENYASVTYFQEFDFTLNNTDYQSMYVTFSNHNYSIPPGTNKLQAWLTITPSASAANLIITIDKKTDTPTPIPSPIIPTNTDLNPSLQLLTQGARWASPEGKIALYVNWLDNWKAHHTTDGTDWQWWSEKDMTDRQTSVVAALEALGFEVILTSEVPEDLSGYDVVVLFAYYAVEPRHEPLIKEYVRNGGSVVLLYGTQTYLASYSKSLTTTTSLERIEDWFGASTYVNAGGISRVAFDNPFRTSLSSNDVLFTTGSYSNAGVKSLSSGATAVAFWDSGAVFAFTHEYGAGRVYYQAAFKPL